MDEITLCTSVYCPYMNDCARKVDVELDSTYKTYYNYSYKCNENSGFPDYIPRLTEEVIK